MRNNINYLKIGNYLKFAFGANKGVFVIDLSR